MASFNSVTVNTFSTWLAALPDAALLVDSGGIIRAANGIARTSFAAQLVDEPLALFIRSPAVARAVAGAFVSAGPVDVEFDEHARLSRTMHAHLARLETPEAGAFVLLILRDRTREAQIEKMRSDFVANASHELRTPLTTISGFIETMQGAARDDSRARETFLKLMKAQADRMSVLIDDLLSLSHIEVDEHVAPQTTIDVSSVVLQAVGLLQTLAAEAQCGIVVNVENGLLVKGDGGQLGQVAYNLVENAIKYAGVGKTVRVTVLRGPGTAVVKVEDNGPGIAAHHLPRLTERFYRVNVQASRNKGGTGLGLAICKHIISRHRGLLSIESTPGKGSTFSVSLPILND